MTDPTMEREMCDLRARLEDMETTQRRTVSVGDLSDSKSEIEAEHEEEVAGIDVKLVSKPRKGSLLSVAKKKREFTMPPRRMDKKTPDPPEDREMPRRRGRQMTDPAMEREMRDL